MWSADVAGVLGCGLRTSRGSWDVEYRLVWVLECGVQMSLRCGDVECGRRVSIGMWSADVAWISGCGVRMSRGYRDTWRADVACAWDMECRCCMGVGMYSADIAWVLGSGVLGFGSGCLD